MGYSADSRPFVEEEGRDSFLDGGGPRGVLSAEDWLDQGTLRILVPFCEDEGAGVTRCWRSACAATSGLLGGGPRVASDREAEGGEEEDEEEVIDGGPWPGLKDGNDDALKLLGASPNVKDMVECVEIGRVKADSVEDIDDTRSLQSLSPSLGVGLANSAWRARSCSRRRWFALLLAQPIFGGKQL